MAPRREETIYWPNSLPREILLGDLENGTLTLDEDLVSAEEAWVIYRDDPAFEGVGFAQFKVRLGAHRCQVKKRRSTSQRDAAAVAHDLVLNPRKTHNHRGERVFDTSPAKLLLREDVEIMLHTSLSFEDLWKSRPEYQEFPFPVFRKRVHQAERRRKMINHLEHKRLEHLEKARKRNKDRIEKFRAKAKEQATNQGERNKPKPQPKRRKKRKA